MITNVSIAYDYNEDGYPRQANFSNSITGGVFRWYYLLVIDINYY